MRSRFRTPIWKDVKQGTPSGVAGGRFVMNDGESALVYNYVLLQENGLPIAQEDGKHIYLETGNA